jgi:hypothetical protein
MKTIQNIQPLNPEALFHLLKIEFPDYINSKLDSALSIDFAHVYDVINVLFPEINEGIFLTITVSDQEITISDGAREAEYNTGLLEKYLVDFITLKAN